MRRSTVAHFSTSSETPSVPLRRVEIKPMRMVHPPLHNVAGDETFSPFLTARQKQHARGVLACDCI